MSTGVRSAGLGQRLSQVLAASWPRIDPLASMRDADEAWRQRRRMQELSDQILDDIGLTREDIARALRR